jgi:lipooligosaccharide transport system permease protein
MAHPSVAVLEYHLLGYRRALLSTLVSSLAVPLLFLIGFGVVLGTYVDRTGVLGMSYLHYLAPGLLASSGLQLALGESAFPVLNRFKWGRAYHAMAAAPPQPLDIIAGHLGYLAVRVIFTACAFLVVMLPLGAVSPARAVLLPPIVVLTGLAGAAPALACAATVDSANSMAAAFRFGMLPMTLFSGVFFPIDRLPVVLEQLAVALPLWHGVALCRFAASGSGSLPAVLGHLVVPLLWLTGGLVLANLRFRRRLYG